MAPAATDGTSTRTLIACIADEDTVTGLLLAGIGHVDARTQKSNFLLVNHINTPLETIQQTFQEFTQVRKDIAILLINQHIADEIRDDIEEQQLNRAFPVIVEIPSKEHPYDPEKDSILIRISKMFGSD